jgi:hypothetical protein
MRCETEGRGVFGESVESGRIHLPAAIATFGCDEPDFRVETIQCGSKEARYPQRRNEVRLIDQSRFAVLLLNLCYILVTATSDPVRGDATQAVVVSSAILKPFKVFIQYIGKCFTMQTGPPRLRPISSHRLSSGVLVRTIADDLCCNMRYNYS